MRPSRSVLQASKKLTPNSGSAPSVAKSVDYCTQLVRASDKDNLWPVYFYPQHSRPAYLALRAFNVELATIDDNVSNPMVGRMRYQWWRDSIKQVFDRSQLSPYHFTRLINSREQHFLNPSFNNLQDLAEYSAGTQASLLYLLLQATTKTQRSATSQPNMASPLSDGTGKDLPHSKLFEHVGNEHDGSNETNPARGLRDPDDLTLDHAASHLAVAITISILLRSIPYHARKRINVIPAVIAARHNMREEALFRQGPNAEGLRECVATMVGIAQAEMRTARGCFEGTTGVPKRASPVFLSATPARSYLDRLSSSAVEFDVFNPSLFKQYWRLPFQVWGDSRNRRF
ncbi:hypothetical protein OIV83_004790 [Microbotryomycetes sp. JL201]|nr:hypothetical protein OIV83_004790 [Microbotryomycetes sp. JL201]